MSKKQNKVQKKAISQKWTRAGTHKTYSEAQEEKSLLLNDDSLQVKIRRRHADENFTVHYRRLQLPAETNVKKEKKQKKQKSKKQS